MSDIITKPLNLPDNPPEPFGDGFVTFTAQEANSTIGLSRIGTRQTLEYSTDNINWNNFTVANTITLSNIGDVVYIRGILTGNNDITDYTQFAMTGKIAASGNCNALWNYNNLDAPLKEYCGNRLFEQCTSLTTAPALPATVLASSCYQYMFSRCTSLTTVPELPATTLASYCYGAMFLDCTSLTKAPELPATTLTDSCYYGMFEGCSSLNYIKCLATDISANSCTLDWVNGVSSSGTFVKNPDISESTWSVSINGIPAGWNVVDYAEVQINNYITFTALKNNVPISLNKISSNQKLWYSTDGGGTWNNFTTGITITLENSGNVCYVAGILSGNNTNSNYTQFNLPNRVSVSGNINSLWNYMDLAQNLYQYCGYNLFNGCTGLNDVSSLSLGISATTLASYCYASMFYGCTSLTTVPELPATNLADYCYDNMFVGCTSLTTAPELPAMTLASYCYSSMFQDCTSLSYIKCLATDISAHDCTSGWVSNVSATGTFVKNPSMTSWTTGNNGIPAGWNVIEETEPVTPEDIANEIMQEVDIFAVPFNDLYETCLSVYLGMGYSVDDFDEVYAVIQSTPNLHDDVETFVVSNDSNEKVITVDNNGDFYLKGVGGYEGKNTKVEDSNIKPLQEVIDEKQTTLVAGDNVQINGNTISATDTTYTASDFDIKDLADSEGLRTKWDNKQNALTAGNNIDITNNVITSKGYTYNNGEITIDGSVKVNGSATVTGKITATNATSHNLVYGRNELNLADLTNGNTLYFNYRNSTNAINEYRFCKGVGNQSTYSDIRCGTLYQTSDITKKNVIGDLDLDKAYDLIDKCQTIIYTLKDDERNKEQIGVIAQEVQQFFPEVVSADENGILAIDYSRLTVVIMKVLKDIIKRVQRLEEKDKI